MGVCLEEKQEKKSILVDCVGFLGIVNLPTHVLSSESTLHGRLARRTKESMERASGSSGMVIPSKKKAYVLITRKLSST